MTPVGFPTICLVTDRRRLWNPGEDEFLALVRAAVVAGVDLVQVRERECADRRILDLTRRIVALSNAAMTRTVVNDRLDVAIAAGSAGVHLRADSPGGDRVRAMSPARFLIGRSVHSVAEARDAAGNGVDYLVMGSVYPTASKPGVARVAGLTGLEAVCRAVRVPVLAIGGITAANVREVAAAGASGIAGIGVFIDAYRMRGAESPEAALSQLVRLLKHGFGGT